jgi:hypothetical protein
MNPSPSLTSPAPAFEFRVPARPKRRSIPSYPQTTSTSPIKPTSSLARRRRASLISASAAGNMLQRVVTDPGPHTADDDDEVMSQAAAIVAEPDEEATEFDSIEQAMVCPPPRRAYKTGLTSVDTPLAISPPRTTAAGSLAGPGRAPEGVVATVFVGTTHAEGGEERDPRHRPEGRRL